MAAPRPAAPAIFRKSLRLCSRSTRSLTGTSSLGLSMTLSILSRIVHCSRNLADCLATHDFPFRSIRQPSCASDVGAPSFIALFDDRSMHHPLSDSIKAAHFARRPYVFAGRLDTSRDSQFLTPPSADLRLLHTNSKRCPMP